MDVRRAGTVGFNAHKSNGKHDPFSAFDRRSGDTHVNTKQMSAIIHLFNHNPSIQAARTILVGQLLSSGIAVKRSGKDVKLTPMFQEHLRQRWLPFARDVIDHTLMFGFVPVSIDEDDELPFAAFGGLKRPREDDLDATKVVPKAKAAANIPFVPTFGTYEIVLTPSGRGGYRRKASVFMTGSPVDAYELDEFTEVFFRSFPDVNGSVVSPISSCFDYVSFACAMRELALSAELVRATPTLVTQSMPVGNGGSNTGIDPSSLFFDSESRQIQASADAEESGDRTRRLDLTVRLAQELNRVRTTVVPPAGGAAPVVHSHLPPEVPPRLFALPEKQVLVPNALQPQSRSDLEALMRLTNDHVAAAFGVPASVIFEGRFSSNSMSQYVYA